MKVITIWGLCSNGTKSRNNITLYSNDYGFTTNLSARRQKDIEISKDKTPIE